MQLCCGSGVSCATIVRLSFCNLPQPVTALRGLNPLHPSTTLQGLRPWARLCLWWLCVAQLCLPLLGKLHDISHGAAPAPVAVVMTVAMAEQGMDAARPSGLKDLFGPHTAGDCQWYGHLALAGGLPVCDAALPVLAPALSLAPVLQALLLRQSPALFFARGPPR